MVQIVRRDNKGFTLIEILIAMVIILVLLMALVQAALLSIDSNLRNLLRDEAVRVAEERMNGMLVDSAGTQYQGFRTLPFDSPLLVATAQCTGADVSRSFRNATRNYRVCWNIQDATADVKRIEVIVGWDYKNETPPLAPTNREFQHGISSIMRR